LTAGRRYLNLNAYLRNSGYHEAAWRVSPADPASVLDPRYSIDLARTAERGVLDSIFLPDSPGVAGWNIVTTFLTQAGSSPPGMALAARYADAVFTALADISRRSGVPPEPSLGQSLGNGMVPDVRRRFGVGGGWGPGAAAAGPLVGPAVSSGSGGDVVVGGCGVGCGHSGCDGGGPEAFDDQPDAKRQLPSSHRESG
jgi:hypothetical protein